MAAAVGGAVISGIAMYTLGARTEPANAFETPALVQTLDGEYATAQPVNFGAALQPTITPVAQRRATVAPAAERRTAPRRTVYRATEPATERVVVEEERQGRSWQKTALIIGGAAASGAGVGAVVDGKKGAAIGAAIGGGAASIYEATRRR
jgi:hypothetical protein